MTELTTTFELLRQHDACTEGYTKLARHLGGVNAYGRTTPITLLTILESNGIADTLWSLRAVPPEQRETRDHLAREFACDCAERVLPLYEGRYPDDPRPREAIAVVRRYLAGTATEAELRAAAADAAYAAAAAAAGEREWQAHRLRELLTELPRSEVTA